MGIGGLAILHGVRRDSVERGRRNAGAHPTGSQRDDLLRKEGEKANIATKKAVVLPINSVMKAGLSGVCGVVTMILEVPYDEVPDYVQLMFSVPYNLNLYGAYFAVGVSEVKENTCLVNIIKY
jgi:hypothetical protein